MRFALSFRPFVLYTCLTLSRFCSVPLSRSPTTINTTNVNNISPLFVVISLSWDEGKDAAAVSLGRRGGLKGGAARAKALSSSERSAIAKRAAAARWKKHRQ